MNATELHSELLKASKGEIAALRVVIALAPMGGAGDKAAPPTHKDGEIAMEKRFIDGKPDIDTVLLDSVQSQANRFEDALLQKIRSGEIQIPLLEVNLPGHQTLTSLGVPHRVHDAIFRDSTYAGKRFRDSDLGQKMADSRTWNATGLYRICPTALLFGTWDSQSQSGVNSAKFARSLVSEIIGIDSVIGKKTSSRIDPLGIKAMAGSIYKSSTEQWTLDPASADQLKGKPQLYGVKGTPADINHGNIPPTIEAGGVTFREARQTVVLSFSQLRKLKFPVGDKTSPELDAAGRAVLAAIGVVAIVSQIEEGYQLRSRCQLIPLTIPKFEWMGRVAVSDPDLTEIPLDAALAALKSLYSHAKKLGLDWEEKPVRLEPEGKLIELVKRSDASVAPED